MQQFQFCLAIPGLRGGPTGIYWEQIPVEQAASHSKLTEQSGHQVGGTCTSCDTAGDVPSEFQVQCVAPSLLVVPGSVHYLAEREPCCALSDCVSTPADRGAPDYSTCSHKTTQCMYSHTRHVSHLLIAGCTAC